MLEPIVTTQPPHTGALRDEINAIVDAMLSGAVKDSTGYEQQAAVYRRRGFPGAAHRCEELAAQSRRLGE